MLRFFFWILLIGNALLLALNLGYFGVWSADTHEPQRLELQLRPEQIHLLSASQLQALNEASREPAPAKASEVLACLEVGNFLLSELPVFEAKLKQLALGDRQSRTNVTDIATHMVFIPSMGSKENADKKAAELRRLGLTDFYIVQDQSSLRWGISLGVFKTEEAAKAHLATITGKGVRSARTGPRTVSSTKFSFQLRALSVDEKARFDLIKLNFPNQETRNCQASAYLKK
jgi:hypothetical protein